MKILSGLLVLLTLAPALAQATQKCGNNEALVELARAHAQDLISTLGILNSMPLDGKVRKSSGSRSWVNVSVDERYSRENGIDSFDVAKKVKEIAGAYPNWEVSEIRARVCLGGDSGTDNAGSIGHGR